MRRCIGAFTFTAAMFLIWNGGSFVLSRQSGEWALLVVTICITVPVALVVLVHEIRAERIRRRQRDLTLAP